MFCVGECLRASFCTVWKTLPRTLENFINPTLEGHQEILPIAVAFQV